MPGRSSGSGGRSSFRDQLSGHEPAVPEIERESLLFHEECLAKIKFHLHYTINRAIIIVNLVHKNCKFVRNVREFYGVMGQY